MSYTKTVWVDGQQPAINADNLNNIENELESLDELKEYSTKIYVGSYTGTGTYGSSHPNTLSFSFSPKFLFIWGSGYVAGIADSSYLVGDKSTCICTWSENGISWYQSNSATYQLNSSGTTYYYVALG